MLYFYYIYVYIVDYIGHDKMLNYNLRTKIFLNSQDNLGNLVAVLGPTNTGKTYYAINRMIKFSSGIIGCPLRLLAREVYDTLVKKKRLTKYSINYR